MKALYIFKVGTTFPSTQEQLGDFDQWTAAVLNAVGLPVSVVDVEHGQALPSPDECAGVVITGSHSMVTDKLPWSVSLEGWLRQAVAAEVPILGVCYGHQLLAEALGGQVGYHPKGKEIGTVSIDMLATAADDALFADLPASFCAQVTHAQSVLELPAAAAHLARNEYEPHQAYRIGSCAWGVQFHPEYNDVIMREYIEQQTDALVAAGRDVPQLIDQVSDTAVATQVLVRFGEYVAARA